MSHDAATSETTALRNLGRKIGITWLATPDCDLVCANAHAVESFCDQFESIELTAKSRATRRRLEIPDEARKILHHVGLALLLSAGVAQAGTVREAPQVGDTYQLTLVKDSAQHGSNGAGGTSHDQDTLIEQVTGVRADGIELQYDLPNTTTAEERTRNWQFPVRVFQPIAGPAQLLNAPELEARLDGWLKAGSLSRDACGHCFSPGMHFASNAIRNQCSKR